MNDAELLKLAAMAAGIDVWFPRMNGGRDESGGRIILEPCHKRDADGNVVEWNPLADDGHAFRLAVKLNLGISIPVHKTIRADVICFLDSSVNIREENGDPYAATRRAIVRAAAEIGKGMK